MDDAEAKRIQEERDKQLTEEYKDVTNPKKPEEKEVDLVETAKRKNPDYLSIIEDAWQDTKEGFKIGAESYKNVGQTVVKTLTPDPTNFAEMSQHTAELYSDWQAASKGFQAGSKLGGPKGGVAGAIGGVALRRGGKEIIDKVFNLVRRGDGYVDAGTGMKVDPTDSTYFMSKGSDAIDDGYIEEIVEQGDNVIYPPGSKEADILANTKAMASDTYHLADFDDTEIFFTTPDPKSFKKSDVISWDKSKILRQEQKLKANEAAREQAYQVALRQAGGDRSKISRKVYEQYAGATNISEVEKVAKRTGHNIGHVIKYMEHNEYQLRQLNSARTLLNDWARRNTVDTMRATLAKYANDRKIVNSNEYKNYVKLAKSLDNATSGIWTKGHKDAIKAVFMRGEFGGNRISNLMLEEGIDSIFRDATTGKLRTIKGNIAKQDRPVDKYTLVNLAGTSWDLTDDFLKVVNPRSVLVDMNEGLKKFGDQYTDIALNAYDKLITEFLQANSIKLNSRKAKTASRAITDGLVAWFEKFDEMQLSGKVKDLKSKLQLPIDIDNAKDYWFRNENTIGKRTQKTRLDPDKSYEIDLLENEFIKAFKRIWDNTK